MWVTSGTMSGATWSTNTTTVAIVLRAGLPRSYALIRNWQGEMNELKFQMLFESFVIVLPCTRVRSPYVSYLELRWHPTRNRCGKIVRLYCCCLQARNVPKSQFFKDLQHLNDFLTIRPYLIIGGSSISVDRRDCGNYLADGDSASKTNGSG